MTRYNREHHAVQTTLKDNLKDVFNRSIVSADPEVLYLIGTSLKVVQRRVLPLSVKGLLLYPENYEFEDDSVIAAQEISAEAANNDDDDDDVENERVLVFEDFLEVGAEVVIVDEIEEFDDSMDVDGTEP